MLARVCNPSRLLRLQVRSLCDVQQTITANAPDTPSSQAKDTGNTPASAHVYHRMVIPSAELNMDGLSSVSKQILAHIAVPEVNTFQLMRFLRETLPQMNLEELSVLLLAAGRRRYVLNLEITTYITNYLASNTEVPKPHTVTQLVSGLQNRNSRFAHVNRLIEVIASKVDACPHPLSSAQIGHCFAGTRNLWSVVPEVQRLHASLNRKFYHCQDLFTSTSLSHIIFGLQNKTSVDPQVRKTLFFVVEKLKTSFADSVSSSFTSSSLAYIFYGFSSLRDDIYEMRKLLMALAELFALLPTGQFNGNNMEAIMGLQSFRGKVFECERFMSALAPHVLSFDRPIHNNQVIRALMGFRCMGDVYPVNEQMIRHLLHLMENSPARFSNSDLMQVLTVIRYIGNEKLVTDMLAMVSEKAADATGHISPIVYDRALERIPQALQKKVPECGQLLEHFKSVIVTDTDSDKEEKKKKRQNDYSLLHDISE